MRRPAAILILLLLTSCRFYDNGKRAAAAAVLHSVLHLQANAPLTQSAVRSPVATPGRARRLIAPNAKLLPGCCPELLRRNPKRAIELCRGVLPGDDLGQLHQRIFLEQRTHARKKLVGNISSRDRHRVRILQRTLLFL
jgi:hypothetical protein